MVVGNKLMNGTKYANDPNESYVHAVTRENTDLVTTTISDIIGGVKDSKGFNIFYPTVILTGISVTAAIVIINQSQYKWFTDNNRPSKKSKKSKLKKSLFY